MLEVGGYGLVYSARFRVKGLSFEACGSGIGVLGFGVWGLGFWGLGFGVGVLGFGFLGLRFGVWGFKL